MALGESHWRPGRGPVHRSVVLLWIHEGLRQSQRMTVCCAPVVTQAAEHSADKTAPRIREGAQFRKLLQACIARRKVQPTHTVAKASSRHQPVPRNALRRACLPAPANGTQCVSRPATFRRPHPLRRRKPSSRRSAIRRSQVRRSSGLASRNTTSATEVFRGKPGMASNWRSENEMFRPHEPESTAPGNEMVPSGWLRTAHCALANFRTGRLRPWQCGRAPARSG